MSEKIYKWIDYVVGLLPLGALFGLMAWVANVEIKDLDLWLHLGVGKYITLTKTIPSVDVLSNSVAGQFWNNHEWLFQIFVYNLYNVWGTAGLLNMQVVLVTVTMLVLLFIGYNRDRHFLTTFALLLVYMVFQSRFTIRPDLFSLFFFTLFIYVLALHIDKKWAIPFLIIVQIFWTNMHGFFFFGPLFILIGLVSEFIKRRVRLPFEWNDSGRLNDGEYASIKWAFLWVCAACLINPQFVEGALYPIKVFFSLGGDDAIFFEYIQELQKPVSKDAIWAGGRFMYYKLLIFVSFITFILNRRNIDLSALLFWLVFLFFSAKAARNISFFAFAAYLVIITNLYHVSFKSIVPLRFTEKKFQYMTTTFLNILLLFWILNYCTIVSARGYYDFDNYQRKSEFGGVSLRGFPQKAADFLVENNIKGNFFNDFNSGAYLVGRTFPNVKVFIDGRTELYGAQFFREYLQIWEEGDKELFEEKSKKLNITGAFLNSARQEIPHKILKYFSENKEWIPVYFDYDAVIFLKDVEENKELIAKHKIDFDNWKPIQRDLFRMGPTKTHPLDYSYRAFSLEAMGYSDAALAEAEEALRIDPSFSNGYDLIGKIYGKRQEYKKAFENFRKAVLFSPNDKKNRYNLALSYFDLQEYEDAIKQYNAILSKWPNEPKALFFIAKSYALMHQYEKSFEVLETAIKVAPKSVHDILNVGDVVFEQNKFSLAKDIYTFALKTNTQNVKVHSKISECWASLGDKDKAIEYLEKALTFEPENEDLPKEIEELKSSL